jgi:hydroxyethylthiazole kinase-like uncharacterized protein yjeF
MRPLSREEVREADRRAIEVLGVPGVVLMENAGRGAADVIEKFLRGPSWAPLAGRRVAVVAGAGNNGGDGFVVARHLHIRGATVAVFLVADAAKITGDAAINLNIIRNLGIDIRCLLGDRLAQLAYDLRGFALIVDAIGGTGIRGRLQGPQATAVEQINATGLRVVALDIPTGLDCDTGAADGPVVRADLTVTFHARKKGFDAPGAERYTGRVVVADIGVPARS